MRHTGLSLLIALVLLGCAPAIEDPLEEPLATESANAEVMSTLISPFAQDLGALGITVTQREAYIHSGSDPDAFAKATNTFYLSNPGFCPLENAFFYDETGTKFMTLAGNNTGSIRGFLYDQSRRPRLTYAYFSGQTQQNLRAIVCDTAQVE